MSTWLPAPERAAGGPASTRVHPAATAPVPASADALPRVGAAVAVRLAAGAADLAGHHAVRRAVFVAEQRLFAGDDRDGVGARPSTLHAVGLVGGDVAGAVRLYPLQGARWQGDRLAVLPAARHTSLGAALVRFAVATAGAAGGDRMVAMVQVPNVRFFVFLGWELDGPVRRYHGRPHQPMAIDLTPDPGR
jgi:putative N-acetyltransferase (TIGR04045 family)